MSGKEPDVWSQLIELYCDREPDNPLPPPIQTLLTVAYRIQNDKNNGTDNNQQRHGYFIEAGMLRGKGAPSIDESLLRVRIEKSPKYQQALCVMLEERGISTSTTNDDTAKSVLSTEVPFTVSQILAPYRVDQELAKLEGRPPDKNIVKKLYAEQHQSHAVVSQYEACERVSDWMHKEPKSLANAHTKYREQIVLSVHFHAYIREQENSLNK